MKVNLGSNAIKDCQAVLLVNGSEVFRLRERDSDNRLVCDFDVRNEGGERLAKVAKNNVVFAADGYSFRNLPQESYIEGPEGDIVARVQENGYDEITITRDFWIEGHHVVISDSKLLNGKMTISGNTITNSRKAISITPNSCEMGCR